MKGYHNQGKDVRVVDCRCLCTAAEHCIGSARRGVDIIKFLALGHHYEATYPLGEVTYSSLPALPPSLSKVDVALYSTAAPLHQHSTAGRCCT